MNKTTLFRFNQESTQFQGTEYLLALVVKKSAFNEPEILSLSRKPHHWSQSYPTTGEIVQNLFQAEDCL
jgi:hypothetical protein